MEKLILADNTEIQILGGASVGSISTEVANCAAAGALVEKLTDENLKKVQFASGEDISGEYADMTLITPVQVAPGTPALLTFGIRERTEEEIQQADVQTAIEYLTDEQALTVKGLYPTFDELVELKYTAKKQGYRFRDGDDLYKTAQDNVTFQAQYRPGDGTESLYTHIDETHAGTIEDPIPAVANMEYEYGKYYSEGETVYICKRGGVPNPEELYGQKVTLQYLPSALIGQYFEVVE